MPVRFGSGRWRVCVATLLFVVLGGCPTRFDPRAETISASNDPAAEHAYREARARLDVGDLRDAETRFASFLEKYPRDPLAPSARLQEARAALGLREPGELKKARELLEPMVIEPPQVAADEPTRARARYLLGLALHRTRDFGRSRELLRPFVEQLGGEDLAELHAILADDAAELGEVEEALKEYALFMPAARPAEKMFVRDRAAELVAKRPPADGRALLARYGLAVPTQAAPSSRPLGRVVGCVLPLSGKRRGLGERALRGALLAADLAAPGLPTGLPVELLVRDSASDPTRAQKGVEELAEEGAAAVVGSPERAEEQLLAPRAASLNVPLLALAQDDARHGALEFKLVRPAVAGARALAKLAVERDRRRRLAVLAPDSAYGHKMAEAFAEAATAAGAKVVADLRYPEGATTFVDPVKRLADAHADGVFVPAPAPTLALIAPQLAASGLTVMPGVKSTSHLLKLYASADGLSASFLQSTAKYLQGAVLAPLFYADPNDPQIAAFVEKYRAAYNEEPSSLDALAFDAVRAARVALDHVQGTPSRAGVAAELSRLQETGVTGTLGFSAGGDRAGAPGLYVVDGDGVRLLK